MTQETYSAPSSVDQLGKVALAAGIAGAAGCVAGALTDPAQLFRSYLTAYNWVLGFALGSLALLMLHHLTRGAWGVMIRRQLEAATRTLPLLFVLFIPIVLGMRYLYPWSRPEEVAKDALLQHKAIYLNPTGFVARFVLYFAIWGFFAFVLNRWSKAQDETGEGRLHLKMRSWSAAGLLIYFVTITFASIDWLMSLTPDWFSTIYGLYVAMGQGVTGMSFVILVTLLVGSGDSPAVPFQPRHIHDYGKLLFAMMLMWTYFALSQFLIIWSGNLPEEVSWYLPRMHGAWKATSIVLVLLHYVFPFALLLSRDRKRDVRRLAPVAVLLLVMRWVDIDWLVAPTFSPDRFSFHWLDVAAPLGLGGIWLWLFTLELKKRSLLPIREPFLTEALAHE